MFRFVPGVVFTDLLLKTLAVPLRPRSHNVIMFLSDGRRFFASRSDALVEEVRIHGVLHALMIIEIVHINYFLSNWHEFRVVSLRLKNLG